MKSVSIFVAASSLILVLSSCENPIRTETKVFEDGSLDKTIIFEKADSVINTVNVFGLSRNTGWEVTQTSITDSTNNEKNNDKKLRITFTRHFVNSEEANKELDKSSDSLFRIQTQFKKSFRWFYTYTRYSETWRPIDRLKLVKSSDYFTQEDKAFLDRLPGEGRAISKADSLYLQLLNEKIFDRYATVGIFEEWYKIISSIVERNSHDQLPILTKNKNHILAKFKGPGEDFTIYRLLDSLGIKMSAEKFKRDSTELSKEFNSRQAFMSFARDGKYVNVVEMPWEIYISNADSISGNKLYWRPLATKFAIQEYEMFAEVRKLNVWAVFLSVIIIGGTVWMFLKKRT